MSEFHVKITQLKEIESLVYTICLKLLENESKALELAESVLCELYQDTAFWRLSLEDRPKSVLKHCLQIKTALQRAPLSQIS